MNRFPSSFLSPALEPLVVTRPSARESPAEPVLWRLLSALWELRRRTPLDPVAKAARLREIGQWTCELHRIHVEVCGELPQSPVIVVSNHLGYIDPVVLCSLMHVSPIAKQEISSWALIGAPLDNLNVSFVRRSCPHSGARVLRRCLRSLQAGVSVLNFPEGTTSRGQGLLPFHLGAFWLSRHTGVPILPVAMDFEGADLCWVDDEGFVPHYAKLCLGSRRRNVRVTFARPLDPARYRSHLDLCWAARDAIFEVRRPYPRELGDHAAASLEESKHST